ncbi:hypothetical protein GCM10009836_21860 [Pseudonocardia ailaonensis]|uniref:Energy-coupling factor transport system substrate-specific component n=2 Tax=Pseudonocardia ailaonensis TaxID=367279 RepID=A0ABN2MWU3_9PSEU
MRESAEDHQLLRGQAERDRDGQRPGVHQPAPHAVTVRAEPAGRSGRKSTDPVAVRPRCAVPRPATLAPMVALRILLAATLLTGPLAAVLVGPAPLPELALPVHGLVSVLVPFTGILLVQERPRLLAAGVIALVAGLVTGLACALVAGQWRLDVLAGGLLVQLVSQYVGTAFGLVCRRVWTAMVADVVVPLGLWAVLPSGVREWITPYAAATRVLTGEAGPPVLVVVLVWVVGFNALGLAVRNRPH